jgi:hypothetical protein
MNDPKLSVEEIKWGIKEGGWLPQKTAHTVVHAGRKEVDDNYAALSGGAAPEIAKSIGQKIGSIYTTLTSETQAQGGNPSSVIFSGIIPENPIDSYNIGYINGNEGIKSVVPHYNSTNVFIAGIDDTDEFKGTVDGTFQYSGIITNVAAMQPASKQALYLANLTQPKSNGTDYGYPGAQGQARTRA